jgi:myo-inositol-1(or 4)-monophosphatase
MVFKKELAFAKELALFAGKIARDRFSERTNFTMKLDQTAVTQIDKDINEVVIDAVKTHFPTHGVRGEEASHKVTAKRKWMCDPIDGTKAYISGIPAFCFVLGLFDGIQQLISIIYNPMLDELYVATKGGGAYLNDERIHVSSRGAKDYGLIGLDTGAYTEADLCEAMVAAGFQLEAISVTCNKVALIARGSIDGFIRRYGDAHDVGVGALLVEEAGGLATAIDGGSLFDRNLDLRLGHIFANPKAHSDLLSIYRKLKK